uniref:Uncharacterized protein n=1 Tax=Onchocerca volvulus TaxID=6282 RepID=A0A8R1U2B9_ONCVO
MDTQQHMYSMNVTATTARAALLCVDIARQDSSKQILQQPYGRLPEMTEHMDRTRLISSFVYCYPKIRKSIRPFSLISGLIHSVEKSPSSLVTMDIEA